MITVDGITTKRNRTDPIIRLHNPLMAPLSIDDQVIAVCLQDLCDRTVLQRKDDDTPAEVAAVMDWLISTRFTAAANLHEGAIVANYPFGVCSMLGALTSCRQVVLCSFYQGMTTP